MFRIGQYAVYPLRPRTEEPGMKKKVRYAAGAVGAAVPAFGLMVPAAAAAAVPAHKPAVSRKTVALHPRILAAASSTSSGAATGACTGSRQVVKTNKHYSDMRFWWTPEGNTVCIGTVKGYDADGINVGDGYYRVRIYGYPGDRKSKSLEYNHEIPVNPKNYEQYSFSVGVHSFFGDTPVQVCGAFVYTPGGVIRSLICSTVN